MSVRIVMVIMKLNFYTNNVRKKAKPVEKACAKRKQLKHINFLFSVIPRNQELPSWHHPAYIYGLSVSEITRSSMGFARWRSRCCWRCFPSWRLCGRKDFTVLARGCQRLTAKAVAFGLWRKRALICWFTLQMLQQQLGEPGEAWDSIQVSHIDGTNSAL